MRIDFFLQLANRSGQILARESPLGGFGSGGHNRRHDYLEGRRRIPVRWVRDHRLDREGVLASLSWKDGWDRPTGNIQVVGGPASIALVYSVRASDDEPWTEINERVALARVAKPFGGTQLFFSCPRCGRRVTALAMGRERFSCRTCLGLVHRSTQEQPVDRAMRRANKLKKKLGAEPGLDSFYLRPKHMRRHTFERIDARIQAAEAEVNDAHIRLLARLDRIDRRARTGSHLHKRGGGGRFW